MSLHRRAALAPTRYLTPSVVQAKTATGTTTAAVTLDSAPTVGNVLVAAFSSNTGAPNEANHAAPAGWTKAKGQGRGTGSPQLSVWWKAVAAGEPSTISFTDAGATGAVVLDVIEATNLHTLNPVEQTYSIDGGSGTATSLTVGPMDATTTPGIVVAVIAVNNTVTWANTWTNSFVQRSSAARQTTATYIASAGGAYTTAETWTTARVRVGIMVGFKAKPG